MCPIFWIDGQALVRCYGQLPATGWNAVVAGHVDELDLDTGDQHPSSKHDPSEFHTHKCNAGKHPLLVPLGGLRE